MIDADLIRPIVLVECGVLMACTLALVVGHHRGLRFSQRVLGYGVLYILSLLSVVILINTLSGAEPTPGIKVAVAALAPLVIGAVIAVAHDIRTANRDR